MNYNITVYKRLTKPQIINTSKSGLKPTTLR